MVGVPPRERGRVYSCHTQPQGGGGRRRSRPTATARAGAPRLYRAAAVPRADVLTRIVAVSPLPYALAPASAPASAAPLATGVVLAVPVGAWRVHEQRYRRVAPAASAVAVAAPLLHVPAHATRDVLAARVGAWRVHKQRLKIGSGWEARDLKYVMRDDGTARHVRRSRK
jgi:hypothetical protein